MSVAPDILASAVAVGNFSGTGHQDIAVLDFNFTPRQAMISLFQNNGNATFGSPTHFRTGSTVSYNSLAAGDLNGDGVTDLVAGGGQDTVSVLAGVGNGTFAAPSVISTPIEPSQVTTLSDLNGDGKPDIVTPDSNGTTQVFINSTVVPTKLVAGPLLNSGYPAYTANAVLLNKTTGQPIAGQLISFSANGTPICQATTNSDGFAKCKNLSAVAAETAAKGYTATYAGINYNLPTTAKGSLH